MLKIANSCRIHLMSDHRSELSLIFLLLQESELEAGTLGKQTVGEEPEERCMFCFKDFPLSVLVEHSEKCTGDMLGSTKRFKSFLPSIHDVS